MNKSLGMILGAIAVLAVAAPGLRPVEASRPRPRKQGQAGHFNKVMIVIFENEAEQNAIEYPFFKRLADEGALLRNFLAITHPSYPNYLALTAGSIFDIHSDSQETIDARHIGDLLEEKGRTWKVYAEDYPGGPGNCVLDSKAGLYARKHVPLLSYQDVQESKRCDNVVNATELARDIEAGTLPDYSLYIPNMENDGHDTDLKVADRWMSQTFGPLLKDTRFTDGLLLVTTFDEDDRLHGNNIYTSFWGAGVRAGTVSEVEYNHYDLLRTIEENFELGTLGRGDNSGQAIGDVWR